MKSALPVLRDALYSSPGVSVAECWSFYLADGPHHWTSYSVDVAWDLPAPDGHTVFSSQGVGLRKGKLFARSGVSVDSLDVELFGSLTVNGASLVAAACALNFTGARAVLRRIYFDQPGGTALDCVTIFDGTVQAVSPEAGSLHLEIRSAFTKPARSQGTRSVQYTCPFAIYDADCGASIVDQTFAVVSADTIRIRYSASVDIRVGDQITFTSGTLNGLSSIVRWVGAPYFDLQPALPAAPAAGDTMRLRAGCNKARNTCRDRFHNLGRYGGAPDAPTKEMVTA